MGEIDGICGGNMEDCTNKYGLFDMKVMNINVRIGDAVHAPTGRMEFGGRGMRALRLAALAQSDRGYLRAGSFWCHPERSGTESKDPYLLGTWGLVTGDS